MRSVNRVKFNDLLRCKMVLMSESLPIMAVPGRRIWSASNELQGNDHAKFGKRHCD